MVRNRSTSYDLQCHSFRGLWQVFNRITCNWSDLQMVISPSASGSLCRFSSQIYLSLLTHGNSRHTCLLYYGMQYTCNRHSLTKSKWNPFSTGFFPSPGNFAWNPLFRLGLLLTHHARCVGTAGQADAFAVSGISPPVFDITVPVSNRKYTGLIDSRTWVVSFYQFSEFIIQPAYWLQISGFNSSDTQNVVVGISFVPSQTNARSWNNLKNKPFFFSLCIVTGYNGRYITFIYYNIAV